MVQDDYVLYLNVSSFRFAAYIEWKIFFSLCKDKNGLLQRDTIRGVYDGSIFEMMENERLSAKKSKQG